MCRAKHNKEQKLPVMASIQTAYGGTLSVNTDFSLQTASHDSRTT